MGVKYVGADVHGQSTAFHVVDGKGAVLVQSAIVPTRREAISAFVRGLGGEVHLALEEGGQARWFRGLLKAYVKEIVVCNPRYNKPRGPMRNKNDRLDACTLAEALRKGELVAVYHGDEDLERLRELVRTYEMMTIDTTRSKNRIKAAYRGCGVPATGNGPYSAGKRQSYIDQVPSPALRQRLDGMYCQLDICLILAKEANREMQVEARRYAAYRTMRTVPGIGPVGAAVMVATVGTPHRFPKKQAFWAYCGLAVISRDSGEHVFGPDGRMRRKGRNNTRGLNRNRNGKLKEVFKTASSIAIRRGEMKAYYEGLLERGLTKEVAQVQVARKLATIALTIWKKGTEYEKGLISTRTT